MRANDICKVRPNSRDSRKTRRSRTGGHKSESTRRQKDSLRRLLETARYNYYSYLESIANYKPETREEELTLKHFAENYFIIYLLEIADYGREAGFRDDTPVYISRTRLVEKGLLPDPPSGISFLYI